MKVFERFRKPNSDPGLPQADHERSVFEQVPANRQQIIDYVSREVMGLTMQAGSLLEATEATAAALIVQKESTTADTESAQVVIDRRKKDLGRSREALDESGSDFAKAAELNFEKIRLGIEAAYEESKTRGRQEMLGVETSSTSDQSIAA